MKKLFAFALVAAWSVTVHAQQFRRSNTNLPFLSADSMASNYVVLVDRGGSLAPANVRVGDFAQDVIRRRGGYVTLRMFGARADAHQFNGSGTDDSAAFAAAIAARPSTNGIWIIDGEGLNYKLDSGLIWLTNNNVTLRNFTLHVTNVVARNWVTIAGDYSGLENVFIMGPGTNVTGQAAAGSVGITITNRIEAAYGDNNHALDHAFLRNVIVWGFATNIWTPQVKNLTIERTTSVNARYTCLEIGHSDGTKVSDSHFTAWYVSDGFGSPYPFFPTNTPDAWISNCTPVLVSGPALDLNFTQIGAGGGKCSMIVRDSTSVTINGLHVEDVNNAETIKALCTFSNVTGVNIFGAFTVKVTAGLPDCFGFLFLDCPSPMVNIDAYGPWGAQPFVATYYNPTAYFGTNYLPAIQTTANRRMPRMWRGWGNGVSYRQLTNLTAMANGMDFILEQTGTLPNTDAERNKWTGQQVWTNAIDGTRQRQTFYSGPIDFYGGTGTEDFLVGSSIGTYNRTADNRVFGIYGSALSIGPVGLLTYQSVSSGAILRLGGDYGSTYPGVTRTEFHTANSYGSGDVERWRLDTTGALSTPNAPYDVGYYATPIRTLYTTNGIIHTHLVQTLTADNQVANFTNRAMLYLSSDNATAANRTFTLSGATQGKVIYLLWSGTNAGELLDDSINSDGAGNARLAGNWTPTQYDTICLMGIGNDWVELFRSAN